MCKINKETLKKMRLENGYTQKELAEKIGVSKGAIQNYESGKNSPTDDNARKIAMVFHVKLDDLTATAENSSKKELTKEERQGRDIIEGQRDIFHKAKTAEKRKKRYSEPQDTQELFEETREKYYDSDYARTEGIKAKQQAEMFKMGNKKYAIVPVDCLNIPSWQRNTDLEKCMEISKNYNENKYDPIKIYSLEDNLLNVADGAHRAVALCMLEKEERENYIKECIQNGDKRTAEKIGAEFSLNILVELLNIKTEDDAIKTFLEQSLGRKTMSQNDMWRAAIKGKIPQYVRLRTIAREHNVQIIVDSEKLDNPINKMSINKTVLRMAHSTPLLMERIFNLINDLNWNGTQKNTPYAACVISSFGKLYSTYDGKGCKLEKVLLDRCKGVTFYDSKIAVTRSSALIYDTLMERIEKYMAE